MASDLKPEDILVIAPGVFPVLSASRAPAELLRGFGCGGKASPRKLFDGGGPRQGSCDDDLGSHTPPKGMDGDLRIFLILNGRGVGSTSSAIGSVPCRECNFALKELSGCRPKG